MVKELRNISKESDKDLASHIEYSRINLKCIVRLV